MDHSDHVRLLRDGVPRAPGTWADLGAGEGAFTLALAELLPPEATIHAIDRDASSRRGLERAYEELAERRDLARVLPRTADFRDELGLTGLDGIVMANSLHFVKQKTPVLARVRAALRPGGRFLVVEYDGDDGNPWVPYPLSFATWCRVAVAAGLGEPRLLATQPSRFMGRIYSAASTRPMD